MVTKSGAQTPDRATSTKETVAWSAGTAPQAAAGFSSILSCVNGSPQAAVVLAWANELSRRLRAPLLTLRVLDTSADNAAPHDPIAWEMGRIDALNRLEGLLEQVGVDEGDIAGIKVAVGPFQESLQAFFARYPVDLCLIGATGEGARNDRIIGDTARHVVETAPCSVLIIPPLGGRAIEREPVAVRRLMVLLDCSRRAEIALPAAIALADAFGAELVIAHAVPEPAITEIGPLDEADIALRRTIAQHNHEAAARYMSRLRARLALDRRAIRTLVLNGEDPRHRLARAAGEESADLIVLAAKGAGGYADQSLGSVADFLVTHLGKPILVCRPKPARKPPAVASWSAAPGSETPGRGRN
jgi:nucleotide-binding universal stress UspA family protein